MLALAFQFSFSTLFATISHTDKGTEYGEKAVVAYTESNHGSDGSLFLDPYFKPDIENLKNKKVLDAGCGAAPWSIYAAKEGGEVYAIDIQEGMIRQAKNAVQIANLANKIFISKGDVASLPYKQNFFDRAISICVGCNLPISSFDKHFQELRRTLKSDGVAIIGAPTSLDVVFSDGSKTDSEIYLDIQKILEQLPNNPSPEIISEKLTLLKSVLSATFYINNNRLTLVANEKDLKDGDKIWRKLPKLVVPNSYYSKEYYINIFEKHNLEIQKIDLPHFANENERIAYNETASSKGTLGQAYVVHAPFMIFHLKKGKDQFNSPKTLEPIIAKTPHSIAD